MIDIKSAIIRLLQSDISSYKLQKITGMSQTSLNYYRNGKSDLDNMPLGNAIKLSNYYNQIKGEIKMEDHIDIKKAKPYIEELAMAFEPVDRSEDEPASQWWEKVKLKPGQPDWINKMVGHIHNNDYRNNLIYTTTMIFEQAHGWHMLYVDDKSSKFFDELNGVTSSPYIEDAKSLYKLHDKDLWEWAMNNTFYVNCALWDNGVATNIVEVLEGGLEARKDAIKRDMLIHLKQAMK